MAIFGLGKKSITRLSRNLRNSEREISSVDAQPNSKKLITNQGSILVKTPEEGLPARSGINISSAECTIQKIDKKDSGDELQDGEKVDVYNLNEDTIGGNQTIMATRDRNGNFIVSTGQASGGVFRVTFLFPLSSTHATATVDVAKSDFEIEGPISARNYLNLEADLDAIGYCLRFADGTVDLIAAECPEES
jgi:hypothetical protein